MKLTTTLLGLSCVMAMTLPAGCGSDSKSDQAPAGANRSAVVVQGRVTFEGKTPPPRTIQVNKDSEACRHGAGEVRDVVVGGNGGLAGVFVEIHGVESDEWKWNHPAGGYSLHQKGCRLSPHVQVVPDGAELTVYNDDPVFHNVNSGEWNVAQVAGAKPFKKTIGYRGRSLIRVNCNVHSWMEAFLYVPQTPFYAETDPDGKFVIRNVPAGKYKITAVHPTLGTKRARVTVEADSKAANQDFAFISR